MGCYHYEVTFLGTGPAEFNQVTFAFGSIEDLLGSPGDTWSIVTSTPIGHSSFAASEFVDPGPVEYPLETTYAGSSGGREYWTASGIRVGADPDVIVNIRWGVNLAGLHIVDLCSNAPESALGWKVAWG